MKIITKVKRFWYEDLNNFERNLLWKYGFTAPEDFYAIPVMSIVNIRRFGLVCTLDLLNALFKYRNGYSAHDSYRTQNIVARDYGLSFTLEENEVDEKIVNIKINDLLDMKILCFEKALYDIFEKYCKIHYFSDDALQKTNSENRLYDSNKLLQ